MAGESDHTVSQDTEHPAHPNQDILTAARGGGILFLGQLFEYGSRFVFGIIVARVLGADGYGLYTLALTAATVLGGIAVLGLDAGMVRFLPPALHKRNEARVWGTLQVGLLGSLMAAIVFAVGLFGLSDLLADDLFHKPTVAPLLRWISLAIPLITIGRVLAGAIRGFKRMQYQVYADSMLFNISRIVLTVALLAVGLGLSGTLMAYSIALLLADGLLLYYLNHLFSLRRPLQHAQRDIRGMVSFSAPICLTLGIRQLGGTLEIFLLGAVGTVAAVGVYSAAVRVQSIGTMFLVATQMATRPIISDLHDRGDTAQLGHIYKTLTRWSLTFIFPYLLTVVLYAKPIMAIFGGEFQEGAIVLLIVSIGTLFSAATGITSSMIIMTGHSRLAFVNSMGTVVLSVLLAILLIPAWGLVGAAAAGALSTATISIVYLSQTQWLLKLWPYDRRFVKPVGASVGTLCIALIVSQLLPPGANIFYLALNVAVLWSAYVCATLLLGLSPEDRVVLAHAKRRFSAALTWS